MSDQPLWRAMHAAHEQDTGAIIDSLGRVVLGEPDHCTYAAEIEAVRDRIAPWEPEPHYPGEAVQPLAETYIRWKERQRIRAELTLEVERARSGE